ncbi:hypothetical protein [Sphingopyxis sp. MC1]|uniref:hypothetical protein n=1 Tax=Sphingopyxis sp. MC1 TaxID=1174684 RepID=UPI0012DF12EF|nr:hypothetical protein [Sphingopyxis sp. MC1]
MSSNASSAPQVQSNMIGFQKDGYRLARHVEHGRNMSDNDDIEESANIPALFAEITALLEDAHEIAVRGQKSKLARTDYLGVRRLPHNDAVGLLEFDPYRQGRRRPASPFDVGQLSECSLQSLHWGRCRSPALVPFR